jgi:hypothetical protein
MIWSFPIQRIVVFPDSELYHKSIPILGDNVIGDSGYCHFVLLGNVVRIVAFRCSFVIRAVRICA